jgi:hypothetical protein
MINVFSRTNSLIATAPSTVHDGLDNREFGEGRKLLE